MSLKRNNFTRNLDEERQIGWTATIVVVLLAMSSLCVAELLADGIKPVTRLMSFLSNFV